MVSRTNTLLLGLATLLIAGPAAYAGEMAVPENVTSLASPEADAKGLPLGGFRAYPRLSVQGGYDSNILASDTGTIEAGRLTLLPSVAVESQWSRHSLSFAGFLESRLYPDESDEDYLDWGFGSKGRLDIQEGTNIGGSVNFQNLTEDRNGIDAPSAAPDPSQYDQFDVNAVLNHSFDQLTGSLGVSYTDLDYSTNNQSYRDREVLGGVAQLGYAFSPGYSAFVRAGINDRDYANRDTQTAGNPFKDSTGYRIVGGISSELTDLIAGEINVGYLDQDYDSAAYEDVDGLSFGASLIWSATPLTSVTVSVARDVVDSTSGGAGGILYTTAGFGVEHALTDDIGVSGDFEYYDGDYKGISRSDDGIRLSAGVSYILSRRVHLDLRYRFDNRDSSQAGQDFDRSQLDLGVEFQF